MVLHPLSIHARIRIVIASKKDRLQSKDIKADMFLEKAPLRFDVLGRRFLANDLNKAFSDYRLDLAPEETETAKQVKNLRILVQSKICQ